jgi:hypothetical protein
MFKQVAIQHQAIWRSPLQDQVFAKVLANNASHGVYFNNKPGKSGRIH